VPLEALMKSLVVYESFYGNTEAVAHAIADGLARHGQVRAVASGSVDAAALEDIDLLVVGSPTHAWGLPRAKTRPQGSTKAFGPPAPLVREWLSALPAGGGRLVAAFDTHSRGPRFLTGSAARGIDRRLRRRGWKTVAAPRSFAVMGPAGPLAPGEDDTAAAWGDELGGRVSAVRGDVDRSDGARKN
jgi:hypothetical protein